MLQGEQRDSCLSKEHYLKVKHKQPCPGFELKSSSGFPTITVMNTA